MPNAPFWEAAYSQIDGASTFGEPAEELADLVKLLPPRASVLDLGCGEGRNALYLAQQGFQVTAIDISASGITKLKQQAEQSGLALVAEVEDMKSFAFAQQYDLIVAHGCLHLIEREHWQPLIQRIQSQTVDGGYNVVVVFTDVIPPPADLKDFHIGVFREGELFAFYQHWGILLERSYILEDEHPGNIRHRHPINKVVARKEGATILR